MADENKVRIKFTQDVSTQEAQPQSFEKGKIYTLTEASARHWINRKLAVAVSEDDKGLEAARREHDALTGTTAEDETPEGEDPNAVPRPARATRTATRSTADTGAPKRK